MNNSDPDYGPHAEKWWKDLLSEMEKEGDEIRSRPNVTLVRGSTAMRAVCEGVGEFAKKCQPFVSVIDWSAVPKKP